MTLMDEDGLILDLQHRNRTLGKIRSGTYGVNPATGKSSPQRSETFIVTSDFQHFVQSAEDTYGGIMEEWQPQGNGAAQWRVVTDEVALDAILPPGPKSPLSQAYEKWTRGGIQRRCNGVLERKSGQPCLCKQQYGEDSWWERAPVGQACKVTTRLNVILPDVPDIGVWLFETHSYHAALELPAHVATMRRIFGTEIPIPIRLFLTQRRVTRNGETKHFPVPAIELRGLTAGQAMAALLPGAAGQQAMAAAQGQQALEAGPPPNYLVEIEQARTRNEVVAIWRQAKQSPSTTVSGKEIEVAAKARVQAIDQASQAWQALVEVWTGTLPELEEAFRAANDGLDPQAASADQLRAFCASVEAEAPQTPPAASEPAGAAAEEPVEADIVPDKPERQMDPAPAPPAPAQSAPEQPQGRPVGAANRQTLTKLNTLFGEAGISGDARFLWLLNTCNVKVTSTAQLTAAKADEAIAKLEPETQAHREDLKMRVWQVWSDLGGTRDELTPAVCLWVNTNTKRRSKQPVTRLDEVSNVHLDAFLNALSADPGKGQITPDAYRQAVAAQNAS
ncbi:hypothetical protein FAF44_02775 [Nonomuraea sp. MG754425]|uniref:recombination directionality factor n=1 Tax=Nonomuraea sp. MG754425 TaxID=2570319 RepID=UPI001F20B887|nr:hypothetical protein [Nonomuraea sp. MG754425]MCF6467338.1 hypothetical protein [Nonomuraea sp. MG754425]